ncbi:MAG: hypothetical protein ACOC22_00235 [bacterium]
MAFIDKKDPVVLNVKITSKGRETLSEGHLHFRYFAIGDSEIDYQFLKDSKNLPDSASRSVSQYNVFDGKALRPVDKNPDILSFITKNFNTADELFNQVQYNRLTSVPSISWSVENSVESIGFFSRNGDNFTFKTTPDFVKQPDIKIDLSDVQSGRTLNLYQSDDYGAIRDEPEIGDYLMVRWVGDKTDLEDTTSYEIDSEQPAPILFYKIVNIVSGSLTNDNLVVEVDRDLPWLRDGGYRFVGAMVFYPDVQLNVEQRFSTDYASEALLSFLQNCQCDTIIFPFWKLSIIYTENIAGVATNDKQYHQYKTNKYNGFVRYIQNQEPTHKKLGVIHYSNVSPANVYAEQFLRDTPRLYLPTIMWHKSSTGKLGLTLKASGDPKTITGVETSLNTVYYDLTDLDGNVVGKVFNDLKLFVIEDQELLFAMSYKSNRSWTLPNFKVGVNDSISFNCPVCNPDFDFTYTKKDVDSTLGKITITGVEEQSNPGGNVYIKVEKLSDGSILNSEQISSYPMTIDDLSEGEYRVTLYDLSAPFDDDCKEEKTIEIEGLDIGSGQR